MRAQDLLVFHRSDQAQRDFTRAQLIPLEQSAQRGNQLKRMPSLIQHAGMKKNFGVTPWDLGRADIILRIEAIPNHIQLVCPAWVLAVPRICHNVADGRHGIRGGQDLALQDCVIWPGPASVPGRIAE